MSKFFPGWKALCLVVMMILATRPSRASQPPASLDIAGLGTATVKLDGPWEFHTGDDPAWAAPAFDDSGWERIGVDKPWGRQSHFGYTGYGWYRRRLHFDPNTITQRDLTLLLPSFSDVAEVYWNGTLIQTVGKMPPHPLWKGLDRRTVRLGAPRDGVLAIRVWKAAYMSGDAGDGGGMGGAPLLGDAQAIADHLDAADDHRVQAERVTGVFRTITFFMGLIGLWGWFLNRTRKVLFWMAVWSLSGLTVTLLGSTALPWPAMVSIGLTEPLFSFTDIAVWFLLLYLLELDVRLRLVRWVKRAAWFGFAVQCLDGLLIPLAWNFSHVLACQIADFVLSLVYMTLEAIPLALIALAIHRQHSRARWLVAGLGAASQLTIALANAASQGQRFTHWTLSAKLAVVQNIEYMLLLLAIIYAVFRFYSEQRKHHSTLEQEYKSAQELQRILIPETLPPLSGFAVTSAYRPAQQVGGDFFQVIPSPDGSALIVVGDVSGKGLTAAMTVSLIVGAIRTLADTVREPEQMLAGLNRRLVGRLHHGFATCIVLRIDGNGTCSVANAGHLSPFLNERELDLPGALPLGLIADTTYTQTRVTLQVGDRLTLYTDGLLEARNAAGEIFGFDRVCQLMATSPNAHDATQAAVEFGQDDDVTVLTLVRLAGGVKSTTTLSAPVLDAIPA